MQTHRMPGSILLVMAVVALSAFGPHQAFAAVTNVVWYRLGENDPGGVSGLAVTNTTTDLVGTKHLKQFGSPLYTNAVSVSASNRLGSSLAVSFNGSSQFFSNAVVSTAVDSFGLEAWVKPNTTNAGTYFIADNGFPGSGGWGLAQIGGSYVAIIGGLAVFGNGIAIPGTWAHVALVRDNGTSSFYVNGIVSGTNATGPNPVTDGFAIGATPQPPATAFFNGTIDEVRVLTFAPGQFSTNDLLINFQSVATLPATALNGTNAMLNGIATPLGRPTIVWFEWGTTTNYGNTTPVQNVGSGMSNTNFNYLLTGIGGGITYHFRAVASNSLGVAFGVNQSFSTPLFSSVAFSSQIGTHFISGAWGDYDRDGRLDVLLGQESVNNSFVYLILLRNTIAGFTNDFLTHGASQGLRPGWGDYDNNGFLDILCPPLLLPHTPGGYTNLGPSLPALSVTRTASGDYDNDGRQDFMLSGFTNSNVSSAIFHLWRNTPELLYETSPVFLNASGLAANGPMEWGDFDNDGLLDLLLNGWNEAVLPVPMVWRNTGFGFVPVTNGPISIFNGAAAWGDYDNDGRLDILFTGFSTNTFIAQVWRNTGNGFTNINAGLPGLGYGSVAWADYDNDGRLDFLLTGDTEGYHNAILSNTVSQLWRNTGNGFTNTQTALPGVTLGSANWGDYDTDGRLDLLLVSATNVLLGKAVSGKAQLWRNNTATTNNPPTTPDGLSATVTNGWLVMRWNAATDLQTPSAGLTYNVRVGLTPGGSEILSAMSLNSGKRLLPQRGNAQHRTFLLLKPQVGATYYWSVQAVDNGFAASAFASEQSFTLHGALGPPGSTAPVAGDTTGDGTVSGSELNLVLSNYFSTSPWLQMTNVAGLGGTNVTFALTNDLAGTFSVEYTTNFANWQFLGPATPRYLFTDTNAPTVPQRYYRLRWL